MRYSSESPVPGGCFQFLLVLGKLSLLSLILTSLLTYSIQYSIILD